MLIKACPCWGLLFTFVALDELFAKELGSDEWVELNTALDLIDKDQRVEILDKLVLDLWGNMFQLFQKKFVHSGKDFDHFLMVAEDVVPLLKFVN